jgi:hypothetical protein
MSEAATEKIASPEETASTCVFRPDGSALGPQQTNSKDAQCEVVNCIYIFQNVIWCRLQESNPRPTDYKLECRLFPAFSGDDRKPCSPGKTRHCQFLLIAGDISCIPDFAYRLLTVLTIE